LPCQRSDTNRAINARRLEAREHLEKQLGGIEHGLLGDSLVVELEQERGRQLGACGGAEGRIGGDLFDNSAQAEVGDVAELVVLGGRAELGEGLEDEEELLLRDLGHHGADAVTLAFVWQIRRAKDLRLDSLVLDLCPHTSALQRRM
jgi:hypothetical protein